MFQLKLRWHGFAGLRLVAARSDCAFVLLRLQQQPPPAPLCRPRWQLAASFEAA